MSNPPQSRLTPDDWARAALDAIGAGGIDALAVEKVAAQLGATKGSFYWHFRNRDALVEAALLLWERRRTEAVIEAVERDEDPAVRLRKILTSAFDQGPADRAELALLAHPDHPAALRAVRRVARRRIGYMAEQLERLGWGEVEARDRAGVLYYIYVGYLQMAHVAPAPVTAAARRRHVDLVFRSLVAPQRPAHVPANRPKAGRGPTGRAGP